ncbi:hypothetical protein [Rubinisphaera sp.]|uniref:hypothetical protein n=1 Tax=Rubinisphaera sp. TaxID=2024857 RepID=UPI0025EDA045|nr:hypothetical protein [Rubinisphaera sp.]|tara:strand:+ start:11846 stop:13237 length:1392 start_codon:yes stop_codon:yes gene_type:complete
MKQLQIKIFTLLAGIIILNLQVFALAIEPCEIQIIDAQNHWPVPLVELKTNHHVRFVTDNAGRIAFDLPELMNVETWFSIEGHGYGVKPDGFGNRGVRLTPQPGKRLTVKVHRQFPAKRLGRLTGAGIFAESQKLGKELDWKESGILGCDSIQIAKYNGKLFWAWGDTVIPEYPLGIFHMTSATSVLKPLNDYEPPVRFQYNYFRDNHGKPRGVARFPGDGPTWISRYTTLLDKNDKQHLVGAYVKIQPPLTAYESGLCIWNNQTEQFDRHSVLWTKSNESPEPKLAHDGHPIFWTDKTGKEWLLFGDPFPSLKLLATFEAWSNPETWEYLEPQKMVSVAGGTETIEVHRGSIAWNEYRKKWVAIFTQIHGDASELGEIWYAEADHPIGPWAGAIKVVTHNRYTFYNPRLHPELTDANSPILLFEGTYTQQFSGNAEATPRYDYNQILYRLDLDDPEFVQALE